LLENIHGDEMGGITTACHEKYWIGEPILVLLADMQGRDMGVQLDLGNGPDTRPEDGRVVPHYLLDGEGNRMLGAELGGAGDFRGDYHALFEQSVVPMALVSMRGEPHFVAASQGFLSAFGLRRAAVVGQPIATVLASHESSDLAIAIDAA
jgi:hypothetical protein